ncbi:MAG: M24 family metallopeptidase [Acidobacteriota bacterium]
MMPSFFAAFLALALPLFAGDPAEAQGTPSAGLFEYDYSREAERASRLDLDHPDPGELRRIFSERRRRVLQSIRAGAMLVFSVERSQPRRLEFQVPHSENHDFTYLTGIEGLDSYDSALLLLPTGEKDWVVLYSSADPEQIQKITGIEDVRPYRRLEEDLSVALTDYRDWRITQIRRWPLPAALAKKWGREDKVLYLNYPRFLRLGMPEPPRLAFFEKLKRFSPELGIRDSADLLDPVRMLHDAYSLASLRRAVQITGEGLVEGLRAVRPGLTEKHVMEVMDFVYRYRGAVLGFPTAVRKQPMTGRREGRRLPEGFIQFVPRSADRVLQPGDMVHVDTGAAFNHHSADIQRNVPVDGRFTPEQRRLYEIALDVQKAVISRVKPGVGWWELHELAVEMLREAGGYDRYYTYGIGHFIGMEVHDEGDYEQPLQPGMVLSIEQGVALPDGPRVAFEDDVLVTEKGHQWLSRFIPIEIDEVEAMAARPSSLEIFLGKDALNIASGSPGRVRAAGSP